MRTFFGLVAGMIGYHGALFAIGFVHGFLISGPLERSFTVYNLLAVAVAMLIAIWVARPRAAGYEADR